MNRAFAGVHHYQGLARKGLGAVAELTKASISTPKSSFSIYQDVLLQRFPSRC